jgi:hypothetical protein
MTSVEDMKKKAAADRKFWMTTGFALLAAAFILDTAFGFDWILSVLGPLLLPFNLFRNARQAKITGDQYLIFSEYRLYAIIMTFAFSSVFVIEGLKRAGFTIDVSTTTILLVSLAVGLIALVIYDRFLNKAEP